MPVDLGAKMKYRVIWADCGKACQSDNLTTRENAIDVRAMLETAGAFGARIIRIYD